MLREPSSSAAAPEVVVVGADTSPRMLFSFPEVSSPAESSRHLSATATTTTITNPTSASQEATPAAAAAALRPQPLGEIRLRTSVSVEQRPPPSQTQPPSSVTPVPQPSTTSSTPYEKLLLRDEQAQTLPYDVTHPHPHHRHSYPLQPDDAAPNNNSSSPLRRDSGSSSAPSAPMGARDLTGSFPAALCDDDLQREEGVHLHLHNNNNNLNGMALLLPPVDELHTDIEKRQPEMEDESAGTKASGSPTSQPAALSRVSSSAAAQKLHAAVIAIQLANRLPELSLQRQARLQQLLDRFPWDSEGNVDLPSAMRILLASGIHMPRDALVSDAVGLTSATVSRSVLSALLHAKGEQIEGMDHLDMDPLHQEERNTVAASRLVIASRISALLAKTSHASSAIYHTFEGFHLLAILFCFMNVTIYNCVYFEKEPLGVWGGLLACWVVFLLDLIWNSHRPCVDAQGKLISDWRKILTVKRNVLLLDLWCLLPVDMILYFWVPSADAATHTFLPWEDPQHAGIRIAFLLLRVVKLLKPLRISSLLQFVHMDVITPAFVTFFFFVKPTIRIAVFAVMVTHCLVIAQMHIAKTDYSGPPQATYLDSMIVVVAMLSGAGPNVAFNGVASSLFELVLIVCGLLAQAAVISNLSVTVFRNDVDSMNVEQMRDTLGILEHFKVPSDVGTEILSYQLHTLNDDVSVRLGALDTLPTKMQLEVLLYVKVAAVNTVKLFSKAPHGCKIKIAESLVQTVVPPTTDIVAVGDVGREMFLISHGYASVVIVNGMTVAMLSRGDYFGEVALLLPNNVRQATVRALTYCDLWVLDKDAFLRVLDEFPSLLNVEELKAKGIDVQNIRKLSVVTAMTSATEDSRGALHSPQGTAEGGGSSSPMSLPGGGGGAPHPASPVFLPLTAAPSKRLVSSQQTHPGGRSPHASSQLTSERRDSRTNATHHNRPATPAGALEVAVEHMNALRLRSRRHQQQQQKSAHSSFSRGPSSYVSNLNLTSNRREPSSFLGPQQQQRGGGGGGDELSFVGNRIESSSLQPPPPTPVVVGNVPQAVPLLSPVVSLSSNAPNAQRRPSPSFTPDHLVEEDTPDRPLSSAIGRKSVSGNNIHRPVDVGSSALLLSQPPPPPFDASSDQLPTTESSGFRYSTHSSSVEEHGADSQRPFRFSSTMVGPSVGMGAAASHHSSNNNTVGLVPTQLRRESFRRGSRAQAVAILKGMRRSRSWTVEEQLADEQQQQQHLGGDDAAVVGDDFRPHRGEGGHLQEQQQLEVVGPATAHRLKQLEEQIHQLTRDVTELTDMIEHTK